MKRIAAAFLDVCLPCIKLLYAARAKLLQPSWCVSILQ